MSLSTSPDTVLQTVTARLEAWAEWYSQGQSYGLGYPPCSLEYRILMGGGLTRSSGIAPLRSHPEAEEMEVWIGEMAAQNPQMAQVLRCHYLKARSLRQGAEQLAMSHMQFKLHLAMAHQWLAGRWSRKTA